MLEKILHRQDVLEVIDSILFNSIYKDKIVNNCGNGELFIDAEQSLFIFLDALYKYKIIISDEDYLDDYISQLKKLFKKFDNFSDINLGINTIIGKICGLKLDIKDKDSSDGKNKILQYIYDKYIVNGYLFHGYSEIYKEEIRKYGLVPEQYNNSYPKFKKIENIFSKKGCSDILGKNFDEKFVYFTDSFSMGCFYGTNAPMYFYRLLSNKQNLEIDDYDETAYFRNDYNKCFDNLNKLMKKFKISSGDKKFITKTCYDEWKLLQRDSSSINILFISRKVLKMDYLDDINFILSDSINNDLGVSVGKIIDSRNNKIIVREKIDSDNLKFINIRNYKVLREERLQTLRKSQNEYNADKLIGAYGRASVFAIMGSILVMLGVISTIIMLSLGV